ncbi:response regulator [Cupriavidus basilensis]|uniref:response regulator n=1 Tax=Cupriavidus basilensis TaxID=68895 RepID=UPI0020A648C5|nr:response regulator transcription factor [Cupriavidus basilensis]MCP3019827.1 response regulator transcription factor [Cupriavidus basilensis]MDR3380625.1 response regulator transcription factor [Cupriavidus basilensis]
MATILIVDDHPALRLVIKAQLSQVLGVSHILEADNGQTAIEAARQFEPDVAVLDLDIPRISGLDVIPRLKRIYPPIRILVISGQDQAVFAPRVRRAGAQGFVSKLQDMKEIVRCVEWVMAGYTVFPEMRYERELPLFNERADEERLALLSDKEIVILQMLVRGLSNKAIGELLFISNKTVSSHKTRIMGKLRATSLVDLVDLARRCRLTPSQ